MKDRFKDCFADTKGMFEYDLTFEGEVVARAKVLSTRDRSKIFEKIKSKYDVIFYYLYHSLISWELGVEITEENLDKLTLTEDGNKLYNELAQQVLERENKIIETIQDNEKN